MRDWSTSNIPHAKVTIDRALETRGSPCHRSYNIMGKNTVQGVPNKMAI